ncbi:thymidine kinase [Clostridium algidicarnis]|uniref:Thymidine kinase n=1 Tax=Clostridium algidicarnis DSM 15099 TaxID=1121295 RepID=A0A2S6FZC0_9CLOT|nr:thymidine kinase [Clostridium algidicarnis]PPK48939.1 thymidine kinase [Clostridium algidicarnis DSM 15099]
MAKLYFRYGAMNSGKSTSLMQVAYNYEERGMKVIIIKPRTDTKGGNKITSRLGVARNVDMLLDPSENAYLNIEGYIKNKGSINCILVDEVQFLKSHHIDELFKVSVIMDIPVICYGLRTDFQMEGFEGSKRLLLLAHSIEEMKTICTCGKKALLNGRKINGRYVFVGNQIAIDNEDEVEYESLCPKCYFKYKAEFELNEI